MRSAGAGLLVRLWLCLLVRLGSPAPDCSRVIQSQVPTSGVIESPGYPSRYGAGLSCEYRLNASPSSVIHVSFLTFDLPDTHPSSGQCLDAYLVIIVVDRQGKEHVGERMCGGNLPAKVSTMQPSVRIQFSTTTASNGFRGFRIQYDILSEAAIREPRSFISPADSHLPGACGGRTLPGQLTGEITSPGYPSTYPSNCTCNWLIRVEPRQRIYIRILHFQLSSTIAECERASITLLDGYKHETPNDRKVGQTKDGAIDSSEARFCGSQLYYAEEGMKSYMSTGNRLIVRLTTTSAPSSSLEGQRLGFKVIWTAVEGLIEPSASLSALSSSETLSQEQQQCDQFICKGGQICVEQGHGVCVTRSQLCIHSSLVCDGNNNCVEGDFSDEQHCYSREIVVLSCASLVSLVCTILLCVCCDQWRKKRRLRHLIRQSRATQNGKADRQADVSHSAAVQPRPSHYR